ncbi:hypothetical protein HYW54_02385 [Candidatus Gottesmanbacteria bacterium]|nr:hypothetical protein [Candidatus Gottesmanbacteria bacterium]
MAGATDAAAEAGGQGQAANQNQREQRREQRRQDQVAAQVEAGQQGQAEAKRGDEERLRKFYYPEAPSFPATTGDAVDRSLKAMKDVLLGSGIDTGEVRRMSGVRAAALPLMVAAGTAATRPMTEMLSAIPGAGIFAALLSPVVSVANRIMGENAFSQAAKFMNRSEDRGLFSRILHGGESRLVKGAFFKEDRNTQQLLRLYDQMTGGWDIDQNTGQRRYRRGQAEQDAWVDNMTVGSRDRIEWLISRGVFQELKAQMIDEHNMQLSDKELMMKERMHDAYRMAKKLYERKIPTEGQRQIFRQTSLPRILNTMEFSLWSSQSLRVAGVTGLKAAGAVALGMAGIPLAAEGLKAVGAGVAAISSNIPAWLNSLNLSGVATWLKDTIVTPAQGLWNSIFGGGGAVGALPPKGPGFTTIPGPGGPISYPVGPQFK